MLRLDLAHFDRPNQRGSHDRAAEQGNTTIDTYTAGAETLEYIGSAIRDEKSAGQHTCYIAVSHQANTAEHGGSQCAFAWEIRDASDKRVDEGGNPFTSSNGDATKGLFPALSQLVKASACGSNLLVLSTMRYFTDHLAVWSELRGRRFLKPNGRTPYADTEAMRNLDAILQSKSIAIAGRRPAGDEEYRFNALQGRASEIAANIGNDPGAWGT